MAKSDLRSRWLGCALVLEVLAFAPQSRAQSVSFYCDCETGLGPCGNGQTTDVPGGCRNSLGAKAYLFSGGGTASVSADDLVMSAGNLPANQSALVYMGAGRAQLPFGDGLRCVSNGGVGLFRFPVQDTESGQVQIGPGIVAFSHAVFELPGHIDAGERWNFQVWYRDPAGPCGSGFNFTNALSVLFSA